MSAEKQWRESSEPVDLCVLCHCSVDRVSSLTVYFLPREVVARPHSGSTWHAALEQALFASALALLDLGALAVAAGGSWDCARL